MDSDAYYSDPEIQRKISHECRYREVVVIKHTYEKKVAIRPFKIFKPEHFQWIYKFLSLDKVPFDLYISNASVKLPKLPSSIKDLANARHRLNMIWEKIMTGYDFFVDCDASTEEDESQLIEWARTIKKEIQSEGRVELWKTGSGGVHLIQKGRFDPEFVRNKVTGVCSKHNIPLKSNVEDPPYIDDSIYDLRRIRRVPYSLHSKTGRVMEQIEE